MFKTDTYKQFFYVHRVATVVCKQSKDRIHAKEKN